MIGHEWNSKFGQIFCKEPPAVPIWREIYRYKHSYVLPLFLNQDYELPSEKDERLINVAFALAMLLSLCTLCFLLVKSFKVARKMMTFNRQD
jgi:hypothetical protein